MGRINSCQKGKAGERELAHALRAYGFDARRGQQHAGGGDSPDVVADVPMVHIECKRTRGLKIYDALAQAKKDAAEGKTPAVFWRGNHGPTWTVTLTLDDFLALVDRAYPPDAREWAKREKVIKHHKHRALL